MPRRSKSDQLNQEVSFDDNPRLYAGSFFIDGLVHKVEKLDDGIQGFSYGSFADAWRIGFRVREFIQKFCGGNELAPVVFCAVDWRL